MNSHRKILNQLIQSCTPASDPKRPGMCDHSLFQNLIFHNAQLLPTINKILIIIPIYINTMEIKKYICIKLEIKSAKQILMKARSTWWVADQANHENKAPFLAFCAWSYLEYRGASATSAAKWLQKKNMCKDINFYSLNVLPSSGVHWYMDQWIKFDSEMTRSTPILHFHFPQILKFIQC